MTSTTSPTDLMEDGYPHTFCVRTKSGIGADGKAYWLKFEGVTAAFVYPSGKRRPHLHGRDQLIKHVTSGFLEIFTPEETPSKDDAQVMLAGVRECMKTRADELDAERERKAAAWFEELTANVQAPKPPARGEPDSIVPHDLINYLKGVYAFLESVAPDGIAIEAFRLPPSPTRAQREVFDAVSGDAHGEHLGFARQDQGDRREDRSSIAAHWSEYGSENVSHRVNPAFALAASRSEA